MRSPVFVLLSFRFFKTFLTFKFHHSSPNSSCSTPHPHTFMCYSLWIVDLRWAFLVPSHPSSSLWILFSYKFPSHDPRNIDFPVASFFSWVHALRLSRLHAVQSQGFGLSACSCILGHLDNLPKAPVFPRRIIALRTSVIYLWTSVIFETSCLSLALKIFQDISSFPYPSSISVSPLSLSSYPRSLHQPQFLSLKFPSLSSRLQIHSP